MIKFTKKDINKFKKMGVLAVYLFGSRSRGENIHSLSDFDFGVVFRDFKNCKGETMNVYSQLYDIIINHLPKNYLRKRMKMRAHEVDIVFLQSAPISMQAKVIQEGKVLYDSNKKERYKYQDYVLERYCDLKYVYNLSFQNLLQRL